MKQITRKQSRKNITKRRAKAAVRHAKTGRYIGEGLDDARLDTQEQDGMVSALYAHDEMLLQEQLTLDKLQKVKSGLMDDLLSGAVPVAANRRENEEVPA